MTRWSALLLAVSLAACQGTLDDDIRRAEDAVRTELRDPDSAKFSGLEHCGKSKIITGRVNAKNRFGALEGEVTFFSDGISVSVSPRATDNGPFIDQFVQLQGYGTDIVTACTAATRAAMAPAERAKFDKKTGWSDKGPPRDASGSALQPVDMNDTDMSAIDVNAATEESVRAADEALSAASNAVERPGVEAATGQTVAQASSQYPGKCYKDYCPCDPPQGGGDSVLCDQLEEGQDPDINLMIAGRGMREARREMDTGDY